MTETVQGFYLADAGLARRVLDISITRLMLALGVFLFAALRGLFTRFVLRRLERITERTETEFDDLLRDAVEEPLRLLFLVMGAFLPNARWGLPAHRRKLPIKFYVASRHWHFFHAVFGSATSFFRVAAHRGIAVEGNRALVDDNCALGHHPHRRGDGLANLGYSDRADYCRLWAVWCSRCAWCAGFVQKSAGGVSILIERRFKIGDWVRVESVVEGTVEDIGFRSTRIRRFDQVPVVVRIISLPITR